MHFSAAFLTLLATTTLAIPTSDHKDKNEHPKKWDHKDKNDKIFSFDKTFVVKADPNEVRNGTLPIPGQPGAKGLFKYGINISENTICYQKEYHTLSGVTGEYQSPAITATHIHEAAKGASGPPRIALPNPVGPDSRRVSYGCVTGPFKTGVTNVTTGIDTGDGFHVKQIVENPNGFFTDSHTVEYLMGAVRGQLRY